MNLTTDAFFPTRPRAGRLVRLGVVLDGRTAPELLMPVARMSERAGIEAIWVVGSARPGADVATRGDREAWDLAVDLAARLSVATIGARLDPAGRTLLDRPVDVPPSRFEIEIAGGPSAARTAAAVREAADRGGRRIHLSIVVRAAADLVGALAAADDIVLASWDWPDLEAASDAVRAAAVEAGRDPSTMGVAAILPVSVGRTEAEAVARMGMDPDFSAFGHPSEVGIFGTLEDCQDRVIALAHSGITDLRCILPATPDVHDVIAQLTAMTVGTTDVLVPGSLRSPAPPPPDGWGGRPDRPPAARVSAGSRRRG